MGEVRDAADDAVELRLIDLSRLGQRDEPAMRLVGEIVLVERAQQSRVASIELVRLRLRRAVDQLGEESRESLTEIASVHV